MAGKGSAFWTLRARPSFQLRLLPRTCLRAHHPTTLPARAVPRLRSLTPTSQLHPDLVAPTSWMPSYPATQTYTPSTLGSLRQYFDHHPKQVINARACHVHATPFTARPTELSVREHELSTRLPTGPGHHTLFGLAHQAKQTAATHPQRAPSSEAETKTAGPVRAPQLRLRAPSSQAPTPGTQIPSQSEDSYDLVSSGPASTTGAKPKGQEEDDVDEDGEGEDDDEDESGDSDWE
ncbi:hypothetical protein FA95DRAFT_1613558 [Auriscalpium vulgare]|uniref:Uncharacterized protein n=1 Tax=Auriscalpium vulgare TaxID=40419 RepID=A0ACB8R2G2_9AGAM|nr:hypothetical protein FA95DRAFT_1613558 [Auriscalpium vulgare]